MLSSEIATGSCCLFFRSPSDVGAAVPEIDKLGWRVLEVDGSKWQSMQDVFMSFAAVMGMPPCYYGPQETFASNANAFLEYLDDVPEWHPAKGHLYVVHRAAALFSNAPAIAGYLAELVQSSSLDRGSHAKLVFVIEGMVDA